MAQASELLVNKIKHWEGVPAEHNQTETFKESTSAILSEGLKSAFKTQSHAELAEAEFQTHLL